MHLADDCILASSDKFRRRLRSADVDTCIVPRIRTRFGDRSFPAAVDWNCVLEASDVEGAYETFLSVTDSLFSANIPIHTVTVPHITPVLRDLHWLLVRRCVDYKLSYRIQIRIWNSLPPELRRPDTELGEFRRLLKTFLFA